MKWQTISSDLQQRSDFVYRRHYSGHYSLYSLFHSGVIKLNFNGRASSPRLAAPIALAFAPILARNAGPCAAAPAANFIFAAAAHEVGDKTWL